MHCFWKLTRDSAGVEGKNQRLGEKFIGRSRRPGKVRSS